MKNIIFFLACIGFFTSCDKYQLEATGKNGETSLHTKSAVIYDWGSVTTGGGGYVTGIVINPTTANRMYIRTDVGGAYRWESSTSEWIPILDGLSTGKGADGIAIDKNNPDWVYAALSDGVYRSNDRGSSWTKLLSTTYSPNADLRWTGECLAVDPNNSSAIYAGTRTDGLWRSLNEGSSWSKIASIPTANVRTVAINPNSTVNGRSTKVYIGIQGSGVYRSTNGGDSFIAMSGDPISPNRMIFVDDLYVAHTTGVAKYGNGTWTDLTPSAGTNKNYCGIAVEVYDPLKIAVCQRYSSFNNPLYRSSNGGSSWEQINTTSLPIVKHLEAPWWPAGWFSSATSCLAFDPLHHGDLYYTDWFGIWFTSNAWASSSIDWYTREKGHEETVVLTLAAPPGGALVYSGVCDVFGFRHDGLSTFPSNRLYDINEGFSIAFCELYPANIAILGSSGNDGSGTILRTSANSGSSWISRSLPAGVNLGRIAISATDPDKMVYVAGGSSGTVYYTTDRGSSWSAASGAPTGAVAAVDVWNKDFALAADCVDGDRFYIFKSGYLYASTNGGATWTVKNSSPIPNKNSYLFIAARPGTAGEVWVSLDNNGLYKTTNGGTTFSTVNSSLTASKAFAWGKSESGSAIPTAYCYGTLSGTIGLYRSTNLGVSWDQIDNGQKFPSGVKALAGDRQTFGRVYVGTGGRGVLYGQP